MGMAGLGVEGGGTGSSAGGKSLVSLGVLEPVWLQGFHTKRPFPSASKRKEHSFYSGNGRRMERNRRNQTGS